MISYQFMEHGKPLQKVLQDTPKPKGTEVLVRVTRSGVCHSDLHIWEGYFELGGGKRFYVKDRGCVPPFTLGHEPFGVVEAVGPKAKGVKVGQKRLVYPWIGWQLLVDDYREMSELNDIGRTEDVSLGWNVAATLGFAKKRFGSDRDATVFDSAVQKGWETGGPGRLLLFSAAASTRLEHDESRNTQVSATGRYFRRNLEKNLFSVSLSALVTERIDPENQVLLGGDNGLRGYPLRYQAGERRAILNVEQRFFTDWYPWRLFRVGYAVFADAGRVGGRDPRASPSLGTLYDVGVGLRLSSPRTSGRSVVHIDLAFPLNRTPTIDRSQLVVETRGSF
jgi:hypothetical protein